MNTQALFDWRRELRARLLSHWRLKALGIGVYITAFMVAYFTLLEHPQFPVWIVPLQPMDRWIAFTPWALWPYVSLWLYVGFAPSLLYLRGEMAAYLSAVTSISVVGCVIFFFWPTAVPIFHVDWAAYPSVAFLKSADAAGNACPSLHVAFSVLTALWLRRLLHRLAAPLWLRVGNALWMLLIIWSTMALKQHVALDVEAGLVLGGTVGWLHLRFWPSPLAHDVVST